LHLFSRTALGFPFQCDAQYKILPKDHFDLEVLGTREAEKTKTKKTQRKKGKREEKEKTDRKTIKKIQPHLFSY
jgi:hypothetical protein